MQSIHVDIGNETVALDWELGFQNLRVTHRDTILGVVPDKADLKVGQRFQLPDGQQFMVIYNEPHGLEVWHNGVEKISGQSTGFVDWINRAGNWLIGLGIFRAIFTFIIIGVRNNPMEDADSTQLLLVVSLIEQAVFIGLGIWGKRTGNPTPFWIAIALLGLGIVFTLFSGSIGGIILNGFVIYYCYKATQSQPAQPKMSSYDPNAPLDQI